MMWKSLCVLSGMSVLLSVSCGGKEGDAVDSGIDSESDVDGSGDESADSGDPGGGDTDVPDPCVTTITQVSPDTDFYYRDSLVFGIDPVDETAVVTLEDANGVEVAGESVFDPDSSQVVFTPDAPLSPGSAYTTTVSVCAGEMTVSVPFSTSDLGGALEADVSSLIDRTYVIALGDADFVQPAGVGALLSGMIDQNILLGVVDANDTSLEIVGAVSESGSTNQDFCNPSLDFPTADFSDSPYFQIGPQDTELGVAGFSVTISSLKISGDFAPDASSFGGGQLTGQVDVRDLMSITTLAALAEDADALCELVGSISAGAASCQPCAEDGQAYCLDVEVINADGEEVSGQVLEPLEECDPERCASGC